MEDSSYDATIWFLFQNLFKKERDAFVKSRTTLGIVVIWSFCLIFKSWDWRKDNLQIVKSSMIHRQKTKLVKELRCITCNIIITLVSISLVLLSSLASSSSPYPLHPNPVTRESNGCLVFINCLPSSLFSTVYSRCKCTGNVDFGLKPVVTIHYHSSCSSLGWWRWNPMRTFCGYAAVSNQFHKQPSPHQCNNAATTIT